MGSGTLPELGTAWSLLPRTMSHTVPNAGAPENVPHPSRGTDQGTLRPEPPQRQSPEGRSKHWKLVGRDALDQAVAEALRSVIQREVGEMAPELMERIQVGFLREFREGISGGGRSLRAVSKRDFLKELERSNSKLVAKRRTAQKELAELETKVQAIETGEESPGVTLGLRAAEIRSLVLGFLEGRVKAAHTKDDLGRGLLDLASGLIREDRRRRGLDSAEGQANEALDVYRRRIEKLRSALSMTESQLEQLAIQAKKENEAHLIPMTSALLDDRVDHEDRRTIMQQLFDENIALRKALRRA
ncbi:MAG: hypothetical protein ACI8PQ_003447 [Planctomycetota bacterium]|jgi:hypothetical protein